MSSISEDEISKLPQAEIVLNHIGWSRLMVPPVSEKINYAITGYESQVLTMKLQPGDTMQGEPGTMMYLSNGVSQSVSYQGCFDRMCSGECCYVVHYHNSDSSSNPGYAALTPVFPTAKIVPVDLSSSDVNGTLIAQGGSFMASYGDVHIGTSWDFNFMRCCCGGLGMTRQKLEGNGTAYLSSTGTIVQKVLQPGETVLIDTNCILAYASTCTLDIRRVGGIVGMFGSGEGIFNTTLTGPGLVIVQSMSEAIFRQALVANKIYRR